MFGAILAVRLIVTFGWLSNKDSQASAHVVYAGEVGPDAGKAVQLVPWSKKAWTECELNSIGISIESADAIWQHQDPNGFARLARMTALICKLHGWQPRWVRDFTKGVKGHSRHADARFIRLWPSVLPHK